MQARKGAVEIPLPRDGKIGDEKFRPTGERRDLFYQGGVARGEAEQNDGIFPPPERLVGGKNGIPAKGLSPRVRGADENPGGSDAEPGEPRERFVGAVPRPVEQDGATGEGDPRGKVGTIEKFSRNRRKITSLCCNPDETVLY